MKRSIFFLIIALFTSSTLADIKTKGEVGLETRFFTNDNIEETKDSNISQKARLEIRGNRGSFSERLRVFARADTLDKTRGIVIFEEAWYGYTYKNLNIKAGAQLLNWSALEAFHPADVLNSRNYDSNFENAEKFGEPMLSINYLLGTGGITAYYMPVMITPNLPKPSNRLRFSSTKLDDVIWIEEDGSISHDNRSDQFAIRIDQSLALADISFHYLQYKDRNQPLFVPNIQTGKIHPVYLPVKQIGGTIQYIFNDFIFKSEFAHRYFQKSTTTELGTLDQPSHYQIALGSEYTYYHSNGRESAFLAEFQSFQGITKAQRAALSLFQHDLLLGHRFVFNDISSTEILSSLIIDLERKEEIMFSISGSRRLGSTWKIEPGIRLIKAKVKSDNYGLQQLNSADQVFCNITRYF